MKALLIKYICTCVAYCIINKWQNKYIKNSSLFIIWAQTRFFCHFGVTYDSIDSVYDWEWDCNANSGQFLQYLFFFMLIDRVIFSNSKYYNRRIRINRRNSKKGWFRYSYLRLIFFNDSSTTLFINTYSNRKRNTK